MNIDITYLSDKIEQINSKIQKLSIVIKPSKLKRVKSKGQAVLSPFRVVKTEQDESTFSINKNHELTQIDNKLKIFSRRKEFLERNRIITQHTDNKSQSTLSTLCSYFSTQYDIYGTLIYEGELVRGQYQGMGRLVNTKYQKQLNKPFSFIENLGDELIAQDSTTWTSYSGYFQNGKFNGMGTIFIDYNYKCTGNFYRGQAQGKVTIIDVAKNEILVIAFFKKGLFDQLLVSNL